MQIDWRVPDREVLKMVEGDIARGWPHNYGGIRVLTMVLKGYRLRLIHEAQDKALFIGTPKDREEWDAYVAGLEDIYARLVPQFARTWFDPLPPLPESTRALP